MGSSGTTAAILLSFFIPPPPLSSQFIAPWFVFPFLCPCTISQHAFIYIYQSCQLSSLMFLSCPYQTILSLLLLCKTTSFPTIPSCFQLVSSFPTFFLRCFVNLDLLYQPSFRHYLYDQLLLTSHLHDQLLLTSHLFFPCHLVFGLAKALSMFELALLLLLYFGTMLLCLLGTRKKFFVGVF